MNEQTKYRGNRTQVFLVLAIGLAFAAQHVGVYLQLGDVGVDVYEVIVLHVTMSVLAPFGIWLAATILVMAVTRFTVRGFMTGDIFRLGGYSLYPLLVAGLVQTAGRLYALRDAAAPELGMYSHLSVEWEEYRAFLETANAEPAFLAATAVAVLSAVYVGYLWSLFLEELGEVEDIDVDPRATKFLGAIPAALCLLWVLTPFLL